MARFSRRRGQGFSLLALAAVCALIGVFVAGTSGPGKASLDLAAAHGALPAAITRSSSAVIQPSLGSSYPQPPSGYIAQGGTYSPIHQQVLRAKVAFDLPKVIMLVEQRPVIRPQPNPLTWVDETGLVYVASPAGSPVPVGTFPPVTVQSLGFGILPVTATVHITQIPSGSTFLPFDLSFSFTGRGDANGWNYEGPLSLAGDVDIRLSDVSVDQVPLAVGPDCHTAAPARLDFEATAGQYNSGGIRIPTDLFLPVAPVPGSLHGLVDVPNFIGCRNADEDLDPLVTALISGKGNPITATQIGPLASFIPPTS